MIKIPKQNENDLVFTAKETAKILKLHYNTVYDMIRTNQIPYFKIGKKILISKDKLVEWINNQGA